MPICRIVSIQCDRKVYTRCNYGILRHFGIVKFNLVVKLFFSIHDFNVRVPSFLCIDRQICIFHSFMYFSEFEWTNSFCKHYIKGKQRQLKQEEIKKILKLCSEGNNSLEISNLLKMDHSKIKTFLSAGEVTSAKSKLTNLTFWVPVVREPRDI